MYYRSVNRGILTTGPGRYTIALVFALGLIAIASGYNGIYLSLSLGIAILIISGVLSERVMKHFEVQGIGCAAAEAGSPFTLEIRAHNRDDTQILYGVECLVFSETPRFTWLAGDPKPRMRAQCLILDPREALSISGTCSGLPRGYYRRLFVVERTLYPFGLLSKFKVTEAQAEVAILPKRDDDLAARLDRQLRIRMARSDEDRDFYSHRPHTAADASKLIDWRRSAGRPESEWVLKVFDSRTPERRVRIRAPHGYLIHARDASTYEYRLTVLKTALDVVLRAGRSFEMEVEGSRVGGDRDTVHRFLAEAPAFDAIKGWSVTGDRPVPLRPAEIVMGLGSGPDSWEAFA